MSHSTIINKHTLEFHGLHLHRRGGPLLCKLGKGREGGHVVTQRCPKRVLFTEGAKAWGLAYLEKKKKEEVTSPLKWEGTNLSTTDAAVWAASGQHCRMKDGSGAC